MAVNPDNAPSDLTRDLANVFCQAAASPGNVVGTEHARYEKRLDKDSRWALSEGSRHFEGKSAVFDALRKVTKRLNDLGIPYAVVGGMALFHHGLRRFTEDV